MTSNSPEGEIQPNETNETGPFVLRTLFANVPLSADGTKDDIKINCVEYLEGNLYIGTSDSEILHFVQIPPDPNDKSGTSTSSFILASRQRPAFADTSSSSRPGVQQILLLPRVWKACILCNWTVTFYSLPELSPVFGTTQVKNCNWIGGVDLNELAADHEPQDPNGVTVLLSLNRRIQVVRIGDDARVIKKIDFAGSTISARRESIACVADSRSYALLEIDQQLKIPLMSISSLDDAQPGNVLGQAQDISASAGGGLLRSNSTQTNTQAENSEHGSHKRGTSLGDIINNATRRLENRPTGGEESPSRPPSPPDPTRSPAPPEISVQTETASRGDTVDDQPAQLPPPPPKTSLAFLKPLIASPTPEEFLLVTGTGPLEPGIGMFVNLDGDPTRPTIEFDRFPKEIVVDGGYMDMSSSRPSMGVEEGYVLASMGKEFKDGIHNGLEIQRWDLDGTEAEPHKFWLEPPAANSQQKPLGIRSFIGTEETYFPEIVKKLCRQRFTPFSTGGTESSTVLLKSSDSRTALSMERLSKERELFERDSDSQSDDVLPEGWQNSRNAEEEQFARRLAKTTTRLAVWSGSNIWWAMRNPLLLQLDSQLESTISAPEYDSINRREIFTIIHSLRDREATSELEFLTFNFIRQRASILLLMSFLKTGGDRFLESELRIMEDILVDGLLDPRVILSLIPGVRNEVIETRRGIWIYGGVKETAEWYISKSDFDKAKSSLSVLSPPVLQFLRRFLTAWRRKKGFGSIPDESEVFRTVDAALLAVLLELDKHSPPGLAKAQSVRSELYELVDSGVDCFARAQTLIEDYHRLFVLSRLYQSRKMSSEVLSTWRRIIEGERDDGAELNDGEQRVREYLAKISSQTVVQEYGLWLANRNPKLGVQVFAEDRGRAPKFDPAYVVQMLREQAPDAVKYYLEYLVFGKGHTVYVDELITYYLDIVITKLRTSADARAVLLSTYESYRALHPPKPTYRQFLTENTSANDEVWSSRLRLLQLLGGAYEYDATAIRERITDLSAVADDLLVPETIILDGREGKHEDALRLLVHHLGDYDTAVAYCFRGGASIYTIYQAPAPAPTPSASSGGGPKKQQQNKQKSSASGTAGTAGPSKRRESAVAPPTQEEQARLFRALLGEFLGLEDDEARAEQTALLLDRFGGWFDVGEVLALIPDTWGVDVVAGFLVKALRRVVAERHESAVARGLSSAQNLRTQHALVTRIDEKGPSVET